VTSKKTGKYVFPKLLLSLELQNVTGASYRAAQQTHL